MPLLPKPGDYFGEMALLSDAPRAATIEALTDCELARLDKKTFNRLVSTIPELHFERHQPAAGAADGGGAAAAASAAADEKLKRKTQLARFHRLSALDPLPFRVVPLLSLTAFPRGSAAPPSGGLGRFGRR